MTFREASPPRAWARFFAGLRALFNLAHVSFQDTEQICMTFFRSALLLVLIPLVIARCSASTAPSYTGTTTSPSTTPTPTPTPSPAATTPPVAPTVTDTSPLALTLFTIYDNTKYVNNLTFVETGTTTCTASAATPTVSCTAIVPEGRLYFSSMTFNYAWTTTKCKLLQFTPYSYKASVSNNYIPPGSTATVGIDCTSLPISAQCYGGAGVLLVPNFPVKESITYEPDESIVAGPQSTTSLLASGYSQNTSSNRLVVNDMPAGKTGTTYTSAQVNTGDPHTVLPVPTDGYIANTMLNYQFTCRDDYYDSQTYVINLFIKDQDSVTGAAVTEDDFNTWAELP